MNTKVLMSSTSERAQSGVLCMASLVAWWKLSLTACLPCLPDDPYST